MSSMGGGGGGGGIFSGIAHYVVTFTALSTYDVIKKISNKIENGR